METIGAFVDTANVIGNMQSQLPVLGSDKDEAEILISHFNNPNDFAQQHEQQIQGDQNELDKDGTPKKDNGELKVCMALNCDKQISRRRLCSTHQKQKERNSGKLELKEDFKDNKFQKGRSPTPFSRHANKYAKLKVFDNKIDQWAGGKEEGTGMLQAYMESSYFQTRYPKHEDSKLYEAIGRNIVHFLKQLPEKSPLRKPLIKAMSENLAPSRLTNILPISKRTIMYSKKLPDNDNLLLTIRYKPNVTRKRGPEDLENDDGDEVNEEQLANDLAKFHNFPGMESNMQMGNQMSNQMQHAHLGLSQINAIGAINSLNAMASHPHPNQLPSLNSALNDHEMPEDQIAYVGHVQHN